MSHVSLTTDATLEAVHKIFAPKRCDGGGWIVRLKESFLAGLHPTMLIDASAVRSGFSQDFFLRLDLRDNLITIRVEPLTIVEHNEGVQRAILGAAGLVASVATTVEVAKYNLVPELRAELDALIAETLNAHNSKAESSEAGS
jgi:hypothetical protein